MGKLQQNEKMFTEAKVVTFLSFEPLIMEELYNLTKIHKNTLIKTIKRLEYRGLVFKHKILYHRRFNEDRYWNYINFKPKIRYKRTYYLLNYSHPDSTKLVKFYYENHTLYNNKKTNRQDESDNDINLKNRTKEEIEKITYLENKVKEIEEEFLKVVREEQNLIAQEIKEKVHDALIECMELETKYREKKINPKEPISVSISDKFRFIKNYKNGNLILKYIIISLPINLYQLDDRQIKTLSQEEYRKYFISNIINMIALKQYFKDVNLCLINEGKKYPGDLPRYKEDNLNQVRYLLNYFKNKTYYFKNKTDNNDLKFNMLIEFSKEPTMVEKRMYPLLLWYSELWGLIKCNMCE